MIGLLVDPFGLPFMARALAEALLLGALGGTVGVLVLLRRLAFVTDALTHTVFPGVVVGFVLAGSGGVLPGALVAGVASAGLFTLLARHRRVGDDAALAILLTGLFAVGVILVSRRPSYTSDLTAFLFGRILTTSPGQLAATAAVLVAAVGTLVALRKELLLRAFDPAGAAAMGYPVDRLDLVVNLVVALVVVAAVQAVGTVLAIALLVVPAAAARLVTDRLATLVALAAGFGALGGWLGLAASFEASVGYGVRLASGATVVLALVAVHLTALLAGRVRRSLPVPGRRARRAAGDPVDTGGPAVPAATEVSPWTS